MKQITIDYDHKLAKLLLTCPPWANDVVKRLPSVRWNQSKRAWAAPITRKNLNIIKQELVPTGSVIISRSAETKIEEAEQAIVKSAAGSDEWPFWYAFKSEPKWYQTKALQKAYPQQNFMLYMDPGTGKSKIFIDLACARRIENLIGAWLVICKRTLRDNFHEQIQLHASIPIDVFVPSDSNKRVYDNWMRKPHDFKCMILGTESFSAGKTYELAESFLRSTIRPMLTVDESSMIASHDAIRSNRIVSLKPLCEYRNGGSGTPIRDNPLNLFMQFEFLDPDIIGIGNYYAFRNRYATLVPMQETVNGRLYKFHKVVGYQNVDELIETIAPYVYQLTKDEAGLGLPPKRYQRRVIPMTGEQRALYDQIRKDRAWSFNGGEEQVLENILTHELRLHQVCGGFTVNARDEVRTVKGIEKIQRVYDPVAIFKDPMKNPKILELLDVMEEFKGSQITVWCMYVPEILAIASAMRQRGMPAPAFYYGECDRAQRDAYDKGFRNGDYRIMLANPQTGSMGLTWVSRDPVVVYYSNSNKLEDRVQSEDRSHRIGSIGDSVMYIDLMMEKSVDVGRKTAIEAKQNLSDYIRARIRHFTMDDLERVPSRT